MAIHSIWGSDKVSCESWNNNIPNFGNLRFPLVEEGLLALINCKSTYIPAYQHSFLPLNFVK